uniref:Transcriptional regulator n=1 Tax=Schlesneria paludicola TaxID=360056 RepID=A0A7C4QNU0_9PLAN
MNAFVDFGIAAAELTPAETIAWLVLFRDTKRDGTARTGQADIARRGRLSVRGVRKAIQSLAAKGMLMVTRRGRLNDGPSTYRLYATPRDE